MCLLLSKKCPLKITHNVHCSNPLLPVASLVELPHSNLALCLSAQPLPPARLQFRREFKPTSPLNSFQRNFKVRERLIIRDPRIGKHKCTQSNLPIRTIPILRVNNLVKVRWNSNVRRVANNLIAHPPLAIRVSLGQVQRSRNDAHRRVLARQIAAEVLKVRPVVAVETLPDLRAHVCQCERVVHGLLAPFRVRSWHLVAAIVAGAEVVLDLGPEHGRDGLVLEEVAVFPVAVLQREGLGRDVLCDPGRVACASVEGAREREAVERVGNGAWEAILEDSAGVNGASWSLNECRNGRGRRRRRELCGNGDWSFSWCWRRDSWWLLSGFGRVEESGDTGTSGSAGRCNNGKCSLGHPEHKDYCELCRMDELSEIATRRWLGSLTAGTILGPTPDWVTGHSRIPQSSADTERFTALDIHCRILILWDGYCVKVGLQ